MERKRGMQVNLAEASSGLDSVTVLEGLIEPIQMPVYGWSRVTTHSQPFGEILEIGSKAGTFVATVRPGK